MYKVFKECFNMESAEDAVYIIATDINRGQTHKHWILIRVNISSRSYFLHSDKFSDIRRSDSVVGTSKFRLHFLPTRCIYYYLFIKRYVPLHVSSLKCSSSGGHDVYLQHKVLSLCKQFMVACQCTVWVLTQTVRRQATMNSRREWQYHMLHVYSVSSLKMSI
jgi:hypothetical protein